MRVTVACGLLTLALASGAQAATCTLSATDVPFGSISQLNPAPVDVQGTVSVDCQAAAADLIGMPAMANIAYRITLSAGQSGTPLTRAMHRAGGAEALAYNIYVDAGHQMVWGDGNNGTAQNSGEFSFSAAEMMQGQRKSAAYLSYARLPANINVPPGDYGDTMTVTLSF